MFIKIAPETAHFIRVVFDNFKMNVNYPLKVIQERCLINAKRQKILTRASRISVLVQCIHHQ